MNVARLALCALLTMPGLGQAADNPAEPTPDFSAYPKASVTITRAGGGKDTFRVWSADTEQQKKQGLMFVRQMPRDCGMLFPQSTPGMVVLWMKNTYLSLDILFIGENGVIADIVPRTTPLSTGIIASPGPVTAALELNAGETARRGIRVGDRVTVERRESTSAAPDPASSLSQVDARVKTKETMECSEPS